MSQSMCPMHGITIGMAGKLKHNHQDMQQMLNSFTDKAMHAIPRKQNQCVSM